MWHRVLKMANRVEEQITAIEQYLDECKYVQFSSTMIKVDKEKLMDMLADLRGNMPEEMARYRKVINERDRILSEARRKAQELVDRTEAQTNELVGNQEIMQQAYAQANEIVALSSQRAQQIEDDAVNDANSYRMAAVQYMDQMLAGMETESKKASEKLQQTYQSLTNQLGQTYTQMTSALQQSYGDMARQLESGCGQYQNALAQYIRTLGSNRDELASTRAQGDAAAAAAQSTGNTEAVAGGSDIQRPESSIPESQTGSIPQETDNLSMDGVRG